MPFHHGDRVDAEGRLLFHGLDFSGLKKRGHGSRLWIRMDRNGNSQVLALDKTAVMRRCNIPARDLRLLDPVFEYPSTILGRENAIVVSLEQIRCIIMAEEMILMKSMDSSIVQFESELSKRLQTKTDQNDNLPFEFTALELSLEFACTSLDAQVTELEVEVYPVLDELALSISTHNLERVRRIKSHLLALTRRVQKVRAEIEQLMDDHGDMAEMYLTEKKERMEAYSATTHCFQNYGSTCPKVSYCAPVSPVSSITGSHELETGSAMKSIRQGNSICSSTGGERIDELEMLLEAYFVVIDHTLSKLLSLKEYIDDTEDFINIKLDNVRNQLIQFEILLTGATFVATIFAVVTGVFGMNFTPSFFDYPSNFNLVLIVTGIFCGVVYLFFMLYLKCKRLLYL